MLSIDEARSAIDAATTALDTIACPVGDAVGHVLARDVAAICDLPPFAQSAMDGWAVRAQDVAGGARLPVGGTVFAGRLDARPQHAPGTATRIMTGAMLPRGADAVIQQELATVDGERVTLPGVEAGTNVRAQGEERRAGDGILGAGARLTPGQVGALSVAGVASVDVVRRPRVAIVTTGDEVVPPGRELSPGQVFDGNQAILRAEMARRGIALTMCEHVADDPEALREAMARARAEADLLLTTGGVSVGEHDHVIACSEAAGYERVFWRVRQKPGKPLWFATDGARAHIGLPGNPGAVWVGMQVWVAQWLDRAEGLTGERTVRAVLTDTVRAHPGVDLWLRVRLTTDDEGRRCASPLTGQASHMLGNLAACDGLVRVPHGGDPWTAGHVVDVVEVYRD